MEQSEKSVDLIRSLIRDVPDFPKKGIIFKDITPLLGDRRGLAAVTRMFRDRWKDRGVTKIASIESRGFILGAATASHLGAGFIPLRKPGKLPWRKRRVEYSLEYGVDALEMHEDAANGSDRVLIVDDLLATGGSAAAAVQLLEGTGARVVGAAFVIELGFLHGRQKLKNLPEVQSIIVYP